MKKDVSIYEMMNGLKKMDKEVFKYLCKVNEIVEKNDTYYIWCWGSIYMPLTSDDFTEFLSEFNDELADE
ncbi:hypothetical protein [Fructilactobacillus frigidiflavus]|uniref:hypothetical protein n=1 Tax=Fructilactobacillus frigidiflavus TaxID=3242688 RepID=UPI003756ED01